MVVAEIALLTSAALYGGFQWTIRLVVYPQLARVGDRDFPAYEAAHQRAVSLAVGPLLFAFGVSSMAAMVTHPGRLTLLAAGAFAGILALTAFGAVPEHRRLSSGFDRAAHRRLLGIDSFRLGLALAAVAAAVALLGRT